MSPPFDTLVQSWLDSLYYSVKSAHTQRAYIDQWKAFYGFACTHNGEPFNLKSFSAITPAFLRAWLSERHKQNYTPASTHQAVAAIRHFVKFLKTQGLPSPECILSFKLPRKEKCLPRPLPKEDLPHVLNVSIHSTAWLNLRDKALFTLLYGAGLRIHEALQLNIKDVQTPRIRILGKGEKEREVLILPQVQDAIQEYLNVRPHPYKNDSPLFVGLRGARLHASESARVMRIIRQSLGLPDSLTPHALRHSCASHLLAHGAGLRIIQDLLGHASLSSTQIYTDLETQDLTKIYLKTHPRFKIKN